LLGGLIENNTELPNDEASPPPPTRRLDNIGSSETTELIEIEEKNVLLKSQIPERILYSLVKTVRLYS
jgi:hypothetical protein